MKTRNEREKTSWSLPNSTANVIRSLREDVHVSHNIEQGVRMVAQKRGERMVAHNITDPPLLRSLLRRRRTFFVENSSIMFTLWFPSIAPVDEIQMKPCLMMQL